MSMGRMAHLNKKELAVITLAWQLECLKARKGCHVTFCTVVLYVCHDNCQKGETMKSLMIHFNPANMPNPVT